MYPRFFISPPVINYQRERITTPDDDFLDLDWAIPLQPKALTIIFHGLEGCSQSHYVRHLVHQLLAQDIACVVMHFRGCSGEPNKQVIAYHSGATFDPEFVIPIVKQRFVHIPLFAVGYSLGGNMLMQLLAHNHKLPVEAAVSVSAPLQLEAAADRVNTGFSKLYQWHLLKSMKRNLIEKMLQVDMTAHLKLTPSEVHQISSFWQFDEHITAPLHGFTSAADYYSQCSALGNLHRITTPTLIIHAQDDPFMTNKVIPSNDMLSTHIRYELSKNGGHVGFMQQLLPCAHLWLPNRITKFILDMMFS